MFFRLIAFGLLLFWLDVAQAGYAVVQKLNVIEMQKPQPLRLLSNSEPVSYLKIWHGDWKKYELELLRKSDNSLIQKNTYNTNPDGFRLVPDLSTQTKDRHLLIAGCSYTYGVGVNDHEVFSNLLARELPSWHVVNLGRGGGSVNEPLYLFGQYDVRGLGVPEEGVLIYNWIYIHAPRLMATWDVVGWQSIFTPLYEVTGEALTYKGTMGEQWSWRFFQRVKEQGLDYWWLRMMGLYTRWEMRAALKRSVLHLVELRKQYLKQFPRGQFVVTNFFGGPLTQDHRDHDGFVAQLESHGITVWQTPQPVNPRKDILIPIDNHPNPLGHRIHADNILAAGKGLFVSATSDRRLEKGRLK